MIVKEEHKNEIINLYFNKRYSYSRLIEHFENKYTYAEIKSVIMKYLKNYQII
jgi:hypothetical protein